MARLVWVLFVCFLLAGCQLPVAPNTTPEVAVIGQPFTLQLGHTARLNGSTFDVNFTSLLTDGRCPTNIQCAATMPVAVEIKIGRAGSAVRELLQLSAHTDTTGAVTPNAPGVVISATYEGYTVALTAVTPYPDAQRKTAASEYRVTLLITGADAQQSSDGEIAADLPQASLTGTLNAEIELKVGESVLIPDEQFWLRFDEVTEDSRCPSKVNCFWSGIVDVRMTVMLAGQQPATFVVGGMTDSDGVVTSAIAEASGPTEWWYQGFTIDLRQVVPYPAHSDRPTITGDYRAIVVITEAKQQPQKPTSVPSPTDIPFPADESGLPILCFSEAALTRLTAGVSTASPMLLTPPVAPEALADEETGDRFCSGQFGEEWSMAEARNLAGVWAEHLPETEFYWVWDDQTRQPVQAP